MAAIYSNAGNRWNILGFNFTKRDALSSVYKYLCKLFDGHLVSVQRNYRKKPGGQSLAGGLPSGITLVFHTCTGIAEPQV
jgi:hypothetical protein